MRNSWFVVLGLFSLLFAGLGCSASVTVDSCSTDSTIACAAGDTGYSCTGSAVPSGSCSADGTGLFCCSSGTTTVVIPTSCAPDMTVAGCSGASTGYSCTSTDAPDQSDPTLSCSVGIAGNAGSTLYCCLSGQDFKAGTCAPDETVAGCAAGSYGFSCAASDTPDQTDSSLVCSTPVAGNAGSSLFCCTSGGGTTTIVIASTCATDTTVAGCSGASTGYSCTSTDAPDQADPTLSCSVGIPGNAGSTLYCCLSAETFVAGTCAPDETVAGCAGGSYGFSCAGMDTPDQTDSTLVCSTPVAGNAGSSLFCCTSM